METRILHKAARKIGHGPRDRVKICKKKKKRKVGRREAKET